MPYLHFAATSNTQSTCVAVLDSDSVSTDYSACSASASASARANASAEVATDGWFHGHTHNANYPSYPIYGRARLISPRRRSKAQRAAERDAMATIRKHLNSSFKAAVMETALAMASTEGRPQTFNLRETFVKIRQKLGYWHRSGIGRACILLGLLVNGGVLACLFYAWHGATGEKRYEQKMRSAGVAHKILYFVLRCLAGPGIF